MEYLFGIHQVLYTTDLRHSILLVRGNVFLNVPYGLSYCRLRIIEESKEYGVCNAKYDDQYTAKDLEERWQIKNTQDGFPSWWVNNIRIMFYCECFLMYPTYRIIINMVILYKGHSRIIFPQKSQLSGSVWNQIDIRAFDEVSIVDEATYRIFGQNVTTYLLLIS